MNVFQYDESDPRPYHEQYADWLLIADTLTSDISTYPGRGDEQHSKPQSTKVVTKRERRS